MDRLRTVGVTHQTCAVMNRISAGASAGGGLIGWVWAAAATGYVLMATHAREESDDPSRWLGFELSVLTIRVVVALAGIFAPSS